MTGSCVLKVTSNLVVVLAMLKSFISPSSTSNLPNSGCDCFVVLSTLIMSVSCALIEMRCTHLVSVMDLNSGACALSFLLLSFSGCGEVGLADVDLVPLAPLEVALFYKVSGFVILCSRHFITY